MLSFSTLVNIGQKKSAGESILSFQRTLDSRDLFPFSYIFIKLWSKGNKIWQRMSPERTLIVIRETYYNNFK